MKSLKFEMGLLSPVLSFLLLAITGCFHSELSGPYSLNEIQTKLAQINSHLPVYTFMSDSPYTTSTHSFYYSNNGSTTYLLTLFYPGQSGGPSARFAKLRTSRGSPALDDALNKSKKVSVSWADQGLALTCNFTPGTFISDSFPGEPYKSCLVLQSEGYWFLLYSVLPLDETMVLVNSLEKAK